MPYQKKPPVYHDLATAIHHARMHLYQSRHARFTLFYRRDQDKFFSRPTPSHPYGEAVGYVSRQSASVFGICFPLRYYHKLLIPFDRIEQAKIRWQQAHRLA